MSNTPATSTQPIGFIPAVPGNIEPTSGTVRHIAQMLTDDGWLDTFEFSASVHAMDVIKAKANSGTPWRLLTVVRDTPTGAVISAIETAWNKAEADRFQAAVMENT